MNKKKDLARKIVRILVRKIPKDKNTLISVGEFLGTLALLYRKNTEIRNFLITPFIEKAKKLEALKRLGERFNLPKEALDVLEYVIDLNAFGLLNEIKRFYDHEVEKLMKASKGYLTLAHELEEDQIKEITQTLERVLGREMEVEVSYDKSLVGGFVFKTSGFVVDASVRRQLRDLLKVGG